jgi:hypothetical protein
MLAQGVGEKLYPHLRPLLLTIIKLSKDKKVTIPMQNCLDALFGNILGFGHLLEKEDGLPAVMDEKKQKNALVRKSTLSYLNRCIERSEEAGPRGHLNSNAASEIATLCITKTKDSDAGVRKEASEVLKVLIGHSDDAISSSTKRLTKELESSNPRLYKSLHSSSNQKSSTEKVSVPAKAMQQPKKSPSRSSRPSNLPRGPKKSPTKVQPSKRKGSSSPKKSASQKKGTSSGIDIPPDEEIVDIDEALEYLSTLNIPNWSEAEDEEGVAAGLKSTNWKFRKEAINALTNFALTDVAKSDEKYPENVLVAVKENTKQFKDSNFNIMKAIIELFIAVFESYELRLIPVDIWMTRKATTIAVGKIADKKFSTTAPILLTRLCELQIPEIVMAMAIEDVQLIKSPLQHEGLLSWTTNFCKDFGVLALGKSVPTCVNWALQVGTMLTHSLNFTLPIIVFANNFLFSLFSLGMFKL